MPSSAERITVQLFEREGGSCRSQMTCVAPVRPALPARRPAVHPVVVLPRRVMANTTRRHRRTSPPSSACSAACCCPRTRSPTWSRSSSPTTSTGPVHATIFDAILDLYGRGEPADADHRGRRPDRLRRLGRIGGAPYLHTLIASVPTAANAAYYARIVAERAVLRRLVEAGTRIVQLGLRRRRPAAAATSTTSSTSPSRRSTTSPSGGSARTSRSWPTCSSPRSTRSRRSAPRAA